MEETLTKFRAITEHPYEKLTKRKEETGTKIVGCLPMYVPEEIIHAAGMLPVVLQEGEEPITAGHSRIQSFFCGVVRSLVDLALKGKLNFLDAVVSPEIDLPINGLANVLRANMNIYHATIYIPCTPQKEVSRTYFVEGLKRFKAGMEKFAGQEITDDRLRHSIEVYNRNHSLLRELYELRRNKPELLNAVDMRSVVMASMLMPKEEHSQLLLELLSKLRAKEVSSGNRVKLVLSGCLCEAPPIDVLNLIEEAGAVIVDDDLYTGSRYFASDVRTDGDLMKAMADRQLDTAVPCPTRFDERGDWGDYLLKIVKNAKAQGVIHIVVKYCQPHDMYYPYLSRRLLAGGVPDLNLEIEHEMLSIGAMKTRIQAFVEMLEQKIKRGV